MDSIRVTMFVEELPRLEFGDATVENSAVVCFLHAFRRLMDEQQHNSLCRRASAGTFSSSKAVTLQTGSRQSGTRVPNEGR